MGVTDDVVTVRFWAAARSAAGVASDDVPVAGPVSLAAVVEAAIERRPPERRARLARVAAICSVMVGEQPVATADPQAVVVRPGDVVELLPPFAGG